MYLLPIAYKLVDLLGIIFLGEETHVREKWSPLKNSILDKLILFYIFTRMLLRIQGYIFLHYLMHFEKVFFNYISVANS